MNEPSQPLSPDASTTAPSSAAPSSSAFTKTASPDEFARVTLEQWARAAAKSAPNGTVDALNWVTPEGGGGPNYPNM